MSYNYYLPPQYSEQHQQQPQPYQLASEDYELKIRQQPKDALLAQDGKERNRKPVDPPPIIEVSVREAADPIRQFLQSPYLFMTCSLVPVDESYAGSPTTDVKSLCGTMVSSLHKLKDVDNRDGGFFVFGDISVKRVGEHRLKFSLFELKKAPRQQAGSQYAPAPVEPDGTVCFITDIVSDPFTVHAQKEYPGLEESTHLSRTFADQGVRLRLRKEARNAGGANRKRSYPYQTSSAQASSSRTPTVSQSSRFGSSPSVTAGYRGYDEPDTKRSRVESYGGTLASQGSPQAYPGYGGMYQSPSTSARLQTPTTLPSNMFGMQATRYPQQYYGQGPTSAPTGSTDLSIRSAPYPSEAAQPLSSFPSLAGYDRSGSGYGATQLQGYQGSSGRAIDPSVTPYGSQQIAYGSIPETTSYGQYQESGRYSGSASGQSSFSGEQQYQQQQQPYGSVNQPYGGSYDPQDRNVYQQQQQQQPPPSGRGWGQ